MKLCTADIEVALMRWINIRQNLTVPRVAWGTVVGHECDLLSLSRAGYAAEYEIKVSKADLKKDLEKPHGHVSPWVRRLYFAVPEDLVEACFEYSPARAGILGVKKRGRGYTVTLHRPPVINGNASKWSEKQRYGLARLGALRIYGLTKKLLKCKTTK